MLQETIKILRHEICSEPPKEKYPANKTDVCQIDNIWSLDILDIKRYCPENNRGYRDILVVTDNFKKSGWTVPLKNKNAQTIKTLSK